MNAPSVDDPTRTLIQRWREDASGTYRSWFLWEERLKNFRSIRRGIETVVSEIEAGTFGNVYKGSTLEVVVGSIAEQRQIFKGADHAFLWKPKLRIPDIYENPDNQRAFGRFLNACACCDTEDAVVAAIHRLDGQWIKGLGPAAANLLYFLHPTLVPPFNTAIVRGYNLVTGARVKLGKWDEFLAMRAGILRLNSAYRELLSNDLGAIAGLLFDIGSERYPAPPRADEPADSNALEQWRVELETVRQGSAAVARALRVGSEADRTHTEIQGWLRDLGRALGYQVWVAANDRNRPLGGGRLADGCCDSLPPALTDGPGGDAIRLIDVLWLESSEASVANDAARVVAAFEVEHTTSIYSGIVRLLDLALGAARAMPAALFLVAPDAREGEVRTQLARPAFAGVADLELRFLPYGELATHRDAMARFGQGLKPIFAVARLLR